MHICRFVGSSFSLVCGIVFVVHYVQGAIRSVAKFQVTDRAGIDPFTIRNSNCDLDFDDVRNHMKEGSAFAFEQAGLAVENADRDGMKFTAVRDREEIGTEVSFVLFQGGKELMAEKIIWNLKCALPKGSEVRFFDNDQQAASVQIISGELAKAGVTQHPGRIRAESIYQIGLRRPQSNDK